MFRFHDPEILFILLIIPLFYVGYYAYRVGYHKRIRRFGNPQFIGQLMPLHSNVRPFLKFTLLMLSLASLIIALARPQFGSKLKEVKREGIELMIALDVSKSMLATDITPNRLERAKQAIANLVGRLKNDQIGLLVFAGDAYTQLPITSDYVSAKMFLAGINPDMVSRQGTAIGKAIRHAMRSFTPAEESSKVIIIISDGENHEDDAIEAAEEAVKKGIKIYTIGMGSPDGSLIPLPNNRGFVTDKQGNPVTSRMNPEMLNRIAVAGQGKYYQASSGNVHLNNLYSELKKLDKVEVEKKIYSEYDDQYSYFVFLSLCLLLIELLVFDRKNRWLSSIKLFS